ncbi:hypothetical protein [Lactococcus protaetiae]|uniref:Uncharacterized protein n=1 Tax=Lactococcus protaetiae TaxID=2592653 RepID=A0A514Z948_9LACT|nr:hypothetical protein [Lactococcus protaetiae]MCL2113537.1 hypothetical protein [Streptococcaceae bacterium]QDK71111.1 hypothetical protein FLP15_08065 [Lactococcus protaetiae]
MKASLILSLIGNIFNSVIFGFLWIGAISQIYAHQYLSDMIGYLLWFSIVLVFGWFSRELMKRKGAKTIKTGRILMRIVAIFSLLDFPGALLLFIASFLGKKEQEHSQALGVLEDDDPSNDWADY